MRTPNLRTFGIIGEAIGTFTSKRRFWRLLSTPLYSNAVYLMLNSAVMSGFGFIFWLIAARIYSEIDLGFASATVSMLTLITLLSLVGLDASLVRFLPQAARPHELMNSCYTLTGLIGILVTVVAVLGLNLWSPALIFIKENPAYFVTIVVVAGISVLSSLIDYSFIAFRKTGLTLAKNAVFSLLKLPLVIILAIFFHSFGIIASWGMALGIAVAISLFLFIPAIQSGYKPNPTLDSSLIKDIWKFSIGNYIGNLVASAPALVLPIMVVNILGPVSNAHFYIAWQIFGMLSTIPFAISQSVFAESSHFRRKLGENVTKSFKFTFLLLVPAVGVVILISKWLLLAFGEGYSFKAISLLWVLSISSLPLGINSIYMSILRVVDHIKELIIIWGCVTVVVLGISYTVMPAAGILGIGYAWLGAQSALAIFILAFRLRSIDLE